jgi:hypothetical protein
MKTREYFTVRVTIDHREWERQLDAIIAELDKICGANNVLRLAVPPSEWDDEEMEEDDNGDGGDTIMRYIVTVKLPKNPEHNPRDKKTGLCPVSDEICTDVTGEHHSYLVEGMNIDSVDAARFIAENAFAHVTRIEQV